MRIPLVLGVLLVASLAFAPVDAATGCWSPQPVHTYGAGGGTGWSSWTLGQETASGSASVWDTNLEDCNWDGFPGDFDGDYDAGIGGAFFGYDGPWSSDPDCNYDLNRHGGNVVVSDLIFGSAIHFFVASNDMSGPVKVVDPLTGAVHCETDGYLSPDDPDDCISYVFEGTGYAPCWAGADGGYWVILLEAYASESPWGIELNNPPTTGTITAF